MERPVFSEETIVRQNEVYTMEILNRFNGRPRTGQVVLESITNAFILGAGGYEGSFDAALVLDGGGLAILIDSLGLSDIDTSLSVEVPIERYEEAVRAAVDFGARWDLLEDEIPEGAISDGDITGNIFGPLPMRFTRPIDGDAPPPWLSE